MFENKKLEEIQKLIEEAEEINPDAAIGLTTEQVKSRIDANLTNNTPKRVSKTTFQILKDNLLSFFNILLLVIGGLYIAVDFGVDHKTFFDTFRDCLFLGILILNILIGLIQDFRARRLCEKLQLVSEPKSKVLRDGTVSEISNDDIVLSDLLVLKLGDQIGADAIVVEGTLEVNESLLTGESLTITKKPGDKIYSGTYVVGGAAKCKVINVGIANYAEILQDKAKVFKRPQSEIIRSIRFLFVFIGTFVVIFGLAMSIKLIITGEFMVNGDKTRGLLTSLISMIPSGMFLLTSIALTVGVINLSNKHVLVQELYCIESLARVDVLCLDKTGTITDGSMKVVNIHQIGPETEGNLAQILYTLVTATKDENATAKAIEKAYNKFHELPYDSYVSFNSETKYSAVNLSDGRTIVLGAREFLNIENEELDRVILEHESRGMRVLVIGLSKKKAEPGVKLGKLRPLGILILEDHIRKDASKNIQWFKDNGVTVKVISGDNAVTVSYIANSVGVENANEYISLEGMSDEEVAAVANQYTVFGRVTPEQKEILITEMKKVGHKVAMTGDGVNDILALKQADCSIAMASGSAAARNASHMVMLDSDFSRLPDVVAEGRRVINNLQRSCSLFLAKTVFAITTTLFFIFTDHLYPFQTPMMFLWEYIFIGIGAFLLSLQPNSEKIKNGFMDTLIFNSLPAGIVQFSMTIIYFILDSAGLLPDGAFVIYSVMSFSIFAFIFLCKVCWKFDKYRLIVCLVLGLFSIGLVLLDYFELRFRLAGGLFLIGDSYDLLRGYTWWVMLVVIGAHIALYTPLVLFAHWIKNHHTRRIQENLKRRFEEYENKQRS